jgi:type IV secretion system protein VirD4
VQVFAVSGTAAQSIAEALGHTTITHRSETTSAGAQYRGLEMVGSRSDGTNVGHAEHSRHLMTAEEISRLSPEDSILLVRGHRPVRARRLRYYRHPAFQGRYDRNPLHLGPQGAWEETAAGERLVTALSARHAALDRLLKEMARQE